MANYLDLEFKNNSAPYISAENLNKMVLHINQNEIAIDNVKNKMNEVVTQKIPEDIIEKIVDDYVEEHQAGLEPKAREMTKSQFDALTPEQKQGRIRVTDENLENDLINDSVVSGSKTWSSQKLDSSITPQNVSITLNASGNVQEVGNTKSIVKIGKLVIVNLMVTHNTINASVDGQTSDELLIGKLSVPPVTNIGGACCSDTYKHDGVNVFGVNTLGEIRVKAMTRASTRTNMSFCYICN